MRSIVVRKGKIESDVKGVEIDNSLFLGDEKDEAWRRRGGGGASEGDVFMSPTMPRAYY